MALTTIGLDGDDTLWHSESYFVVTTERLVELLMPWAEDVDPGDGSTVASRLVDIERVNLDYFGYGVKSFTLSMVQTAIEVSEGRVSPDVIQTILGWGKELMKHPVELIEGVEDTLAELSQDFDLLLITKGDLLHQEAKIAMSGLEQRFDGLEIVSEKDRTTYERVLARHSVTSDQFLMVGNSVRSDILPVVELGADAVHVPYEVTWALEMVEQVADTPSTFHTLNSIVDLPGLIQDLERS